MIRPVGMGCVSFKSKTIMGGTGTNTEPKNEEEKPQKTRGLTRNERNIFLAGAFVGAVTGIGGYALYDNIETEKMLNDMKMELDACHDQELIIEDVTGDNIPDIMLKDLNDDAVYYDFMKNKAYLRMGDETIDKLK